MRPEIRYGYIASTEKEKHEFFFSYVNILIFFPRIAPHQPPTIPESLKQIGPGISEIMMDQLYKSAVLGYQSLARLWLEVKFAL